ncbi:MAG TPA: TIGR03364 family FAD-dependent oxidoreductase [Candidatus Dormibacteraeota bacterium]|nr:TIGR03364 family FAD-dependent oxidoreductase [Candidatus Dormibacteraeota bacterium]
MRVAVVGGGALGTLHAWAAIRRGHDVAHLEREAGPRGASVRNFGLIWVSGREAGEELDLAQRARDHWERIAADHEGTGFRAAGSLTVAVDEAGIGALELGGALPDARDRGFQLLTAEEARRRCPALGPEIRGALWCARDAILEPRRVLSALRAGLERSGRYRWLPGRTIREVASGRVLDHTGERHEADLVVVCTGADHAGLAAAVLAGLPLRRVRLQMLETAPLGSPVGPALADADSLRYYPAFAGAPREALGPQDELGSDWGAQLLLVQRADGSLTIGDTHRYEEPFPFDYDTAPERHLLASASRLLGASPPEVCRRWCGVYSQFTGDRPYARAEPEPGLVVVTGPGGRGMTMSPAIAEETFT